MTTERYELAAALRGFDCFYEADVQGAVDELMPVVEKIAARKAAEALDRLREIVDEMESDESIGIPPHVPLLIEALRGVLGPR